MALLTVGGVAIFVHYSDQQVVVLKDGNHSSGGCGLGIGVGSVDFI